MPHFLQHLYDEHADALFAFVLNLTRNEADTRDVLQEVFRRLAAQPSILDEVRDTRAYLIRLAHNAAVDLMRRRTTRDKYHAELADEAVSPFEPGLNADEATFRTALASALAGLPPEQRAVVHLKLWEHATFEQIGATLDIPLNTAASRYRYALDKLRAALRPLYDEIHDSWTTSNNS